MSRPHASRVGQDVARERRHRARTDALTLLPEVAARPAPEATTRHGVLRVLLAVVASVVLLGTIGIPLALVTHDDGISSRIAPPTTRLDATDLKAYRAAAADDTSGNAPIVLSYHDIRPGADGGEYVISPQRFAAQMQMLDEAGYTSLTLDQFLAYREGTYTPPARSFLLTFDDGTKGLWRYADPILERYGMNALSFVITGSVGTRQPYYLTWAEIRAMHDTGRWSFGSHTDDLHHRVATGPDSRGGALTHRRWSASPTDGSSRWESTAAFRARVSHDLDRSVRLMAEHGLPAPTTFSYPFSDLNQTAAGDLGIVESALDARFHVTFVNAGRDPRPATRRDRDALVVERLEIFAKDTDRSVFDGIRGMSSLSVTEADGAPRDLLDDTTAWRNRERGPAALGIGDDGLQPSTQGGSFVAAGYAPALTTDWVDYVVEARVEGLRKGSRTIAVTAREGSDQPVRLRLSAQQAQVVDADDRVIAVADVRDTGTHTISMTVGAARTVVVLDGRRVGTVPVTREGTSTGGITVDWSAAGATTPGVSSLSVRPR